MKLAYSHIAGGHLRIGFSSTKVGKTMNRSISDRFQFDRARGATARDLRRAIPRAPEWYAPAYDGSEHIATRGSLAVDVIQPASNPQERRTLFSARSAALSPPAELLA